MRGLSRPASSGACQPRSFFRCFGVRPGTVGCVVRRSAVLLDIVAEVVVRVPATRRRRRNARPRRGMNAFGTRAGSESPGRFSRLERQEHRVPSHLSERDFSENYDRHAPPPDRVPRSFDRVLHAVTRCPWRGEARTLAAGAKSTHGGILREDRVDDRDGRPNGQRRVSGLEAQSRARGILIRNEHPWASIRRDDGQCSRRGGDFVAAIPAAAGGSHDHDGANSAKANAARANVMSFQSLPVCCGIHIAA